MINQQLLDQLADSVVDDKNVFSAVFHVEDEEKHVSFISAAGKMKTDDYYYIASVTKLFISAVVLILKNQNMIDLDEKVVDFFPDGSLDRLHVLKGKDSTNQIRVRHLISNTSGIPDYFFGKDNQGRSGADEILAGHDGLWTFEKTLDMVKNMKPDFYPGQKGKAVYSDTNYQLLGKILERITGLSMPEIFDQFLFKPLGLKKTYTYVDPNDSKPVRFYYKNQALHLPQYMTSIASEGGIVSDAEECMAFLKSFFNGHFFNQSEINALKHWNFMLRPATMYFGIGLEKLWTPWFMSPGKPIKDILGFWGQTGSFAFYHQDSGLYFTGTTNQINGRGHNAALKTMIKLIRAL